MTSSRCLSFSWQYCRGFCRKNPPADSGHSNGYELCPSSRLYLSVFIRSGLHTFFALNGKETASLVNLTYRYINDVLSINNSEFEHYLCQMNPAELEIKDTTESTTSASYLDILSIGRDGQLHNSLNNKRDDFHFHITNFPFPSSNIPSLPAYGVFVSQLIRNARACSSYECIIPRSRRFSRKFLKQGCFVERLKSSFGKFYGRYGDLIQQYEVSLSRMFNDILILDQHWLPNWSDFLPISWPWYLDTERDLHRIIFVSMEHCKGCDMPTGNANIPDTWFRPFLGACICSDCRVQFSLICTTFLSLIPTLTIELQEVPIEHLQRMWHARRDHLPLRTPGSIPVFWDLLVLELAVSLLDFSPWLPLGTFSILLQKQCKFRRDWS